MAICKQPWFVDKANYKDTKHVCEDYTWQQNKQFYKEVNQYLGDEPYMFKISVDSLIHKCVASEHARNIMWDYNSSAYGSHRNGKIVVAKVLQIGLWWPTLFKIVSCMFKNVSNVGKHVTFQNETKCPLMV